MSEKPFHCEGLFVSHSGCYVLSLPRENVSMAITFLSSGDGFLLTH